jgi:uncharacterized membrane protein (Fun14 family)
MGKKLQITNTIIILGLLIFSIILLLRKFPSSLDIALELPATIFLWFFLILFLIWSILIILSFFKTDLNNPNYTGSAITNIVLAVIGLLITVLIFSIKWLSQNGIISLSNDVPSAWAIAFVSEGSLALFLIISPFAFFISFIVFVIGFFKNRLKKHSST